MYMERVQHVFTYSSRNLSQRPDLRLQSTFTVRPLLMVAYSAGCSHTQKFSQKLLRSMIQVLALYRGYPSGVSGKILLCSSVRL